MSALRQRLEANSIPEPNSACQLWLGALTNGYGRMKWRGRMHSAHRLSWEERNGRSIPDGMCVCHKCDVRACINPDHLFTGTQLDNMRDMIAKGRKVPPRKLTTEQVIYIRESVRNGSRARIDLAAEFGVTPQAIHRVVHRLSWSHM